MSFRIIRLFAWLAVAVVITVVAIWQFLPGDRGAGMEAASIGGPFSLTDQNGETVTEKALEGRATAMFFGYTHCPDVCPTTLFEATAWLDALGDQADALGVVFVTVDPERDTREILAEYLQAFDPRITALTGSREAINGIIKSYHVYARRVENENGGPGDYLMDHTASVYLLDRNTNLVGTIDYEEDPDVALEKLRRLIARG